MTLILLFISVKVDFMLKPFSVNKENKETLPSNKSASYSNAYLNISFGLMHTCQLSRIIWESPALLYGSPYLPDKIIVRALLCLFTFLAQKLNFSYSQYGFWGIFACIQSLTKIISGIKTKIANFDSMYSCKTSYNVQSHSHWGLGQFVRGGRVEFIEIPGEGQ